MGYILLALVAGRDGVGSMWFYLTSYALMLIGAFTVASIVAGPRNGRSPLPEWAGLSSRSPWLAWSMLIMLLAMGGIPFTSGFIGKIAVFSSATDAGYLWLMVLALLTMVVGMYVYFRVAAVMFMDDPDDDRPLVIPATSAVVLVFATVATVLLGLLPWPLLEIVREALPL